MLDINLSGIAEITGGRLIGSDARVGAIVTDSRSATPGTLFVALRGEKVDGHDFLQQVSAAGAAGAMVERMVDCALPQVIVPSCMKAIADIARHHRSQYLGTVFSITGSSGKTSTKEMLVSILSVSGKVIATSGNQNNEIGVPLTVFRLSSEFPFAVVEMGAAQKGDIAYLMDIVGPDIVAITNVGTAHVGRFGSEEVIAETKAEIYARLKPGGKAVVNMGMKYAPAWQQMLSGHDVKTFSATNPAAEVSASAITLGTEGSSFVMHHRGEQQAVTLSVPGIHNIENALCAAACALQAGITLNQVVQGLEQFVAVSSRLQKLAGSWGGVLIDDCYNANPGSVRAAIDVLAGYAGRKIMVLGDMAELGQSSHSAHEKIGQYAREKGIDILLGCGIDSELATRAFGAQAQHFSAKPALIDFLRTQLVAGDVVLVKGSRSAALEEVVKSIMAKVAN